MKELEEILKIQICDRVKGKLYFTEAGKEFLESAEKILNDLSITERKMQEIGKSIYENYIHGYSVSESSRLKNQAQSIGELLHFDSHWPEGSTVLEIGCGVGAQTVIISQQNRSCQFYSADISDKSLKVARQNIDSLNIENVSFFKQDVYKLTYPDSFFDHVFVCFLLEHLKYPANALQELKRVLKPEGTVSVIEGDHGSTFFHPNRNSATTLIQAQVKLQKSKGGNANIGRELYPLLDQAGFKSVENDPR